MCRPEYESILKNMFAEDREREQNKTNINVERKGNIQIRGAIRMRFTESILFTDTTV